MNCKLELLSIVLFALGAGVVGGITSSLADEAGVEARVGELRGEILSLLAPAGAVATETGVRVTRRRFPVGANPTRQPLQPEAIGAVMEVTKWL